MTAINIKTVQIELQGLGLYKGALDGISGPLTESAVEKALSKLVPDVAWRRWSNFRKRIAVMQALFRTKNIETGIVDGYVGPQTLYAFEVWRHIELTGKSPEPWRDGPLDYVPEHLKPTPKPVKSDWPRQRDLTKYYGARGKNQTLLTLPYTMKIAWNKAQLIRKFSIHEKCHDSASRVFGRIASHYSPEERVRHGFDLFGGCLNVRKMRGGSSWSTHAWGIAIDFDPIRNQLRWGRDRAYLDEPECVQFWKFWEEEGWLSLGRARNMDWQHVQAARL